MKLFSEYQRSKKVMKNFFFSSARTLEMQKTQAKAQDLTEASKGKHHIGDFLPPEELTKFLKKVHQQIKHVPFLSC